MSQKTFEIMNKLAGLSWSLADDKSVVGKYTDPSDREKVRIAYPFRQLLHRTGNALTIF